LGISVLPLLVAAVVYVRLELLKASAWNRRRRAAGKVLAPVLSRRGIVIRDFRWRKSWILVEPRIPPGDDAVSQFGIESLWGSVEIGLL